MPLQPQPLLLPIAAGLDSKSDPKLVPATRLTDAVNVVLTKDRTVAKRSGYRALTMRRDDTDALITDALGLATRQDEVMLFAEGRAYSHRASRDRWAETGEVSSVIAKAEPIARTGTEQSIPDVAVRGGLMAIAWEDSRGGVWASVVEEASRCVLLAPTQLDPAGLAPRCLASDDRLLVLWTAPGRISCAVVSPSSPGAALVPTVVTEDLSLASPRYDAEGVPHGSFATRPAVIAWISQDGGYRLGYLTPQGTLGSPLTGYPSVVTGAAISGTRLAGGIAVCAEKSAAGAIAVLWGDDGDLSVRFHTADTLATIRTGMLVDGPLKQKFDRIAAEYGAPDALGVPVLYWAADTENIGESANNYISAGRARVADDDDDGLRSVLRGHTLVTRAFHDGPTLRPNLNTYDGHVYVAVAHAVQLFPYVAVVRLSSDGGIGPGHVVSVARLLPIESAGAPMRSLPGGTRQYVRHLSSVAAVHLDEDDAFTRVHALPLCYRITLAGDKQRGESGVRLFTLDFDADASYQTAEVGRGMYLAGAQPSKYDGDHWCEAGYHTAPDAGVTSTGAPSSISAVIGGGVGLTGASTYQYAVWYEDVDGQGELDPGGVNSSILVTTDVGTASVTLEVPTYRLTAKRNVRICVARSLANGAVEAMYRVTSLDPSVTSGQNCYLANDPTVDIVTFVDDLTDLELQDREPLYTNGGIVSNDPAPWAGDVIASSKSRLYWTDPADPDLVRYSKTRADDTSLEAPVRFSLRVDRYGGRITAIGALDGLVAVFRETAVYAFGGPGPEADGGQLIPDAAFSSAELVTSDVGCTDPASLGQTPIGLMFKSAKGMKLLDRSRQVQDIGAAVDGYRDQRVTRTTLLPQRNEIVCLTDDGSTLCWNYEFGQWTRFTNHEGYDAVVADGLYLYVRPDGRVFVETPGEYRDDRDHIPMLLVTAWIKLSGYLQGWQRVLWAYFLGAYLSPHTLRMRYRLDYKDNWSAPNDMNVDANFAPSVYGEGAYGAGPYGGHGSSVYQRRRHLNKRCQAIQLRLEDVELPTEFGASFELSELLIVGGVLGASFKPGAARST